MIDTDSYLATLFYVLFFWPTYVALALGPFIFLLKNFDDPTSFLLDFSIILFTVGMFALIVSQHKNETYANFSFIGSLYLLSGSLALTVMFMSSFVNTSGGDFVIISELFTNISRGLGEVLITLLFLIYSFSFSVIFGVATVTIIESTFKEISSSISEGMRDYFEER